MVERPAKSGALFNKNKTDLKEYGEVITNLSSILDNAVLIERHVDKSGKNEHLEQVYVLLGGYKKGKKIYPVEIEIKKFDNADNQLYVAITIEKNEVTESHKVENTTKGGSTSFNISLQQLVENVNPSASDILKYIPKEFLSLEQQRGRIKGMFEDIKKYDKSPFKKELDNEYQDAVRSEDIETAQMLVDEAAKNAGYTIKAYHGSRQIFNEFSKDKRGSNTRTKVSNDWFFAADKETANSYYPYGVMKELARQSPNIWKVSNAEKMKQKGKLYNLYIKMENPLVVDVADYDYTTHRENADAWYEYTVQAEENGNDGIILLNAMDNQLKTSARESTVYMFKDPNQAKSADPVERPAKSGALFNAEADNSRVHIMVQEDLYTMR